MEIKMEKEERTIKSTDNNPHSIKADGIHPHYNASHVYVVQWLDKDGVDGNQIKFQQGPVKEVGNNGISNEDLLEIVADRLRCFQNSPFSCKANSCALTHIEEALHWLDSRTKQREERKVEGTSTI